MKTLLMFIGVVLLFTKGNSLECYSCTDCLPSFLSFVEDTDVCWFPNDSCYKEIEDDGSVNRGCTSSITCAAKDISPGRCIGEVIKPCYICCNADDCNSSTTVTVSFFTFMLSIGAAIISQFV
ncbi:hypothetical protein HOLleu_15090 [Holothuria leucospilota]|uniref:Uncharacterized protein n=1 Tax=Holothuria leucospilota TaxID=206669 RepID=A0A9Q1HD05_HOLLE|nr:hypothetical protein HOLleu_15090 [Holothuria leucospilota]